MGVAIQLRMSQSVDTAKTTTTAPSATTAAPTTSTSTSTSNSAAQEAAGLSTEPPPATGSEDLLETLPLMGEVGTVVLDAMPLSTSLPIAVALYTIGWVAEWVQALDPAEVLACGASTGALFFRTIFQVGHTLTVGVQASVTVPPGLELSPTEGLILTRTEEGWDVTLSGTLAAAAGASEDAMASVTGAEGNSISAGASATAGQASSLTIETTLSEMEMLAILVQCGVGADGIVTCGIALAAAVAADPEAKVITSQAMTGTAGAGVSTDIGGMAVEAANTGADSAQSADLTELANQLSATGASVGAAAKVSVGLDGWDIYGAVEFGYDAKATGASSTEADPSVNGSLRVEAWAEQGEQAPEASLLDRVHRVQVTFTGGDEVDQDASTLEGEKLSEVPGLLAAGIDVDVESEVIGDLTRDRVHQVEHPAEVAPLVAGQFDCTEKEFDAFIAEYEVSLSTAAKVRVTEEAAVEAAPEGADAELVRDVQRAMAGEALGMPYEAAGFDPEGSVASLEIAEAKVTATSKVGLGMGGALALLGVGAVGSAAESQDVDVLEAAKVDPELVPRLLSA